MSNTPESDAPLQNNGTAEPTAEALNPQQMSDQLQQPVDVQVTTPLNEVRAVSAQYAPHPSHLAQGNPPVHPQGGAAFMPAEVPQQIPHQAAQQPTSKKGGMLIAGIAIGALIGGVVGGGISAVALSSQASVTSPVTQNTGNVTLNNLQDATITEGVAAVATPSVVTLDVIDPAGRGSGSGVVYEIDGDSAYVITNNHVVTLSGAASSETVIKVWLSDGRILEGELVGTDPYSDIAVVRVPSAGLQAIAVADSSVVAVGDTAIAIGAPLNLPNTVTTGVVSALYRGISVGTPALPNDSESAPESAPEGDSGGTPWDFQFGNPRESESQSAPAQTLSAVTLPVIQTDASINPGNSGGALLNANGELIGINVAIASTREASGTAGSVGLGFSVPSNLATRIADELIAGEKPSHGLLGIGIGNSTDLNAGGIVQSIVPGGAAETAGMREGDIITEVNGIPAHSGTAASALVRMYPAGEEITIKIMREGAAEEISVVLGELEW